MYLFYVVRGGKDISCHKKVDEAFKDKPPGDFVFVELVATGYRARVLRPGPERWQE